MPQVALKFQGPPIAGSGGFCATVRLVHVPYPRLQFPPWGPADLLLGPNGLHGALVKPTTLKALSLQGP